MTRSQRQADRHSGDRRLRAIGVEVPKQRLEEHDAKVDIVSLKPGEIWGWSHDDWGDPVKVDKTIDTGKGRGL